jgi:hypothetical protein
VILEDFKLLPKKVKSWKVQSYSHPTYTLIPTLVFINREYEIENRTYIEDKEAGTKDSMGNYMLPMKEKVLVLSFWNRGVGFARKKVDLAKLSEVK